MNKLTRHSIRAALVAGTLLTALHAQAQTSIMTAAPVSSMGTITEFSPKSIIINTETGKEPVTYNYNKTTTYVDEAGNPVSMTTVKSGTPVTVYYSKSGEEFVASKVIVRNAIIVPAAVVDEKKTTTTTTETQ